MKPIVIYLDKKDSITLSKTEFEKYLKEAYDAGYSEGYAAGNKYYTYPWWWTNTSPTITTTNTQPLKITWDTGTQPEINLPHITCDGANDLNNYKTTSTAGTATYNYKTGELTNEKT